jgi:putative SOS response-associated peptidase YedK
MADRQRGSPVDQTARFQDWRWENNLVNVAAMCCRYVLQVETLQALAERLALSGPIVWRTRYNLAPGEAVPVVRMSPGGEGREIAFLRWGLVPAWTRAGGREEARANARAETLAERPAFRSAFRHRRCLVPASGYYEWRSQGGRKQPWLFRLRDGAPLVFAGLWENSPDRAGGGLETCTVITTAPNQLAQTIHNRMPAILAPDDAKRWLDPRLTDPSDLAPLLRPFAAAAMTAIAVSERVNNVRHDDAGCLEPVNAPDAGDGTDQMSLNL